MISLVNHINENEFFNLSLLVNWFLNLIRSLGISEVQVFKKELHLLHQY